MAARGPSSVLSRDLEKKITCGICHEHYTEPKKLTCGHCFCKQCILRRVQKVVVDEPFICPECGERVALPGGSVDQLEDDQECMERLIQFCQDEIAGLEKAICCVCTLGDKVIAFCQKCKEMVCDTCVKAHRRMKAFSSHQLVTLEDLKREEAEQIFTKKCDTGVCPVHGNHQIAFSFDCSQLSCHKCIVEDRRGHHFVFNRATPFRDKQRLLKELERLEIVEKFILDVQGNEELVGAQEDMWEDVQESFGELHRILEDRKEELLEEVNRREQERKNMLAAWEVKLCKAFRIIQSLMWEVEQCVNEGTDEEVIAAHVDLVKRIEASVEEYSKPEWSQELELEDNLSVEVSCAEPLEQLCNDEIKIVHLQIEPSKCTVYYDEDNPPRVNRTSTIQLIVRLSNGRPARSTCKIDCELARGLGDSVVDSHVERVGGGIYNIKFTPTTNEGHWLRVQVNDEEVPDSPFPFFVYVAPLPEDQETPKEVQLLPMTTTFEYTEDFVEADDPWLWEEHGLELLFQDEVPTENPFKKVEVSATPAGEFELPDGTELASVAFLVQCPFELKKEVQMKIPHFASDIHSDDYELSFVVSRSISSPFVFELVDGGEFNTEKGELKVTSFSMYAVVFVFKHGLKEFPDFLRNSYLVSLHRSNEFKFYEPNRYDWEICFSVVKNVATFQNLLKRFSLERNMDCCTESIMKFNKVEDLKIIVPELSEDTKGWSVDCGVAILKEDIDGYTNGTPPHGKFKLTLVLDQNATHFSHVFQLEGVRHQTQELRVDLAKPKITATGRGVGYDGPIDSCLRDLLKEKDLQEKYRRMVGKIVPHQRIFLDEDLGDAYLSRIAEKLSDWKNKPHLIMVEYTEQCTLQEKHRGNPIQERMEALDIWRRKSKVMTFNRLLAICIVGEWLDGTKTIIEIVNTYEKPELIVHPPPPPTPVPTHSSFSYIKVAAGVAVVAVVATAAVFTIRKFRT